MRFFRPIIVLLAIAGSVAAQPPRPEPGSAPHETDPAAMKARLERWLEETRHREETIQAALKRLSDGASPDDVRRSMEPGTRPPRGGAHDAQGGGRPDEPGRSRREGQAGAPHDGPPGGPEGRSRPPLDREQVLAFIDGQNPEFAARMRTMVRDNPEVAERILSRIWPQIHEVMTERDEQTREIRTAQLKNGWEVMGGVRGIREAVKNGDDAARAKAVQRVRDLLGVGFDLRVRLHEREITVLEERLTRLKQELADERSGRDSFVAERLRQATEPREHREPRSDSKPPAK